MKLKIILICTVLLVVKVIEAQQVKFETYGTEEEIEAMADYIDSCVIAENEEITLKGRVVLKNMNAITNLSDSYVGIMPREDDVDIPGMPKIIIHLDNEDSDGFSNTLSSTMAFNSYVGWRYAGLNSLHVTSNKNSNLTFFLVPLSDFADIINEGAPFDFAVLNCCHESSDPTNFYNKCDRFDRYFDCEDGDTKNHVYFFNINGTPDGKYTKRTFYGNFVDGNIKLSFLFFKAKKGSTARMPRFIGLDSYYVFGRFGHNQHVWLSDDEDHRNTNSLKYYKSTGSGHSKTDVGSNLKRVIQGGKNTMMWHSLVTPYNMQN